MTRLKGGSSAACSQPNTNHQHQSTSPHSLALILQGPTETITNTRAIHHKSWFCQQSMLGRGQGGCWNLKCILAPTSTMNLYLVVTGQARRTDLNEKRTQGLNEMANCTMPTPTPSIQLCCQHHRTIPSPDTITNLPTKSPTPEQSHPHSCLVARQWRLPE